MMSGPPSRTGCIGSRFELRPRPRRWSCAEVNVLLRCALGGKAGGDINGMASALAGLAKPEELRMHGGGDDGPHGRLMNMPQQASGPPGRSLQLLPPQTPQLGAQHAGTPCDPRMPPPGHRVLTCLKLLRRGLAFLRGGLLLMSGPPSRTGCIGSRFELRPRPRRWSCAEVNVLLRCALGGKAGGDINGMASALAGLAKPFAERDFATVTTTRTMRTKAPNRRRNVVSRWRSRWCMSGRLRRSNKYIVKVWADVSLGRSKRKVASSGMPVKFCRFIANSGPLMESKPASTSGVLAVICGAAPSGATMVSCTARSTRVCVCVNHFVRGNRTSACRRSSLGALRFAMRDAATRFQPCPRRSSWTGTYRGAELRCLAGGGSACKSDAGCEVPNWVGRLFIGGLLSREASLDPFPHGRTYAVD